MTHHQRSVVLLLVAGMSSSCTQFDPTDLSGEVSVSGTVVDFVTGEPLAGGVSVTTSGLNPSPAITMRGAEFTVDPVPKHSVFHLLSAGATYRSTYGSATFVEDDDLTDVKVQAASESYMRTLETMLGAPTGAPILLARVVDVADRPRANIPRSAFLVNQQASPTLPFFSMTS